MISGNIRKNCGKNESYRSRKQGMLPAVIYGMHMNNLNVEIGTMDLINEIREKGEHSILELNIEGHKERVMVKELQKDPVNHKLVHMDLQRIEDGQIIHTRIPVVIKGDKSLKNSDDIVRIQQSEVDVECPVEKLPSYIVADVSNMGYGSRITLGDLKASNGAYTYIIGNPDSVVASIGRASRDAKETSQKENTPAVYA